MASELVETEEFSLFVLPLKFSLALLRVVTPPQCYAVFASNDNTVRFHTISTSLDVLP